MIKTLIASTAALTLFCGSAAQADALMAFDVAENHKKIFMAEAPLHENGMPAHGNAFISQGYIYPAGTLEADTKGVLEDGSPAYPNKVLGTWTCDGYLVGDGGNAKTGVWIISRQVFDFKDGDKIITQGTEIVDTGVENLRPITGASGDYREFHGDMAQTLLGFSEQMTVNVSFRLTDASTKKAQLNPADMGTYAPNASHPYTSFDQSSYQEDHHLDWDSGFSVGPIPTS